VVYRYKDIEGRQIRQERTPGEIQGDVRTRSFTRYSTDVTRFARRGSGDGLVIGSTGAVGDKDSAKAASSGFILSSEIATIRRHQP
jgi:hypothetical protein